MAEIGSSSILFKKLKQVLFKQRLVLFAAGLLMTVTVLVLTAIGLSLLANVMVLPVWFKATLLLLSGAVTLFFFGRFAVARLFAGDIESVAVRLETKHPDLKGRLIAAIQFARMRATPGYSRELMALTEKQALEKAGLVNFNEVLTFHPLLKTARLLVIAGVVAAALVLAMPGVFSYSYEVYSNPTTEIAPPLGYQVVPIPGSTEWVKYRDIEIGAAVFGDHLPKKAKIYHRLVGGNWQSTEIDLREKEHFPIENGDSVNFAVTLRQINRSFDYYVEAGRVKTEIQKVDVVDRPRVTGIKLSIFYPDYTGLPPTVIDENNGSFSALVGSRVNMEIETNLPVQQAELVFADTSRTPLRVEGKMAGTSLRVEKSRSYHIRLVDHLGEQNPDPIEYYITAIPDEYPSIDVLRPGFDVNLNDEMLLPLKVRIYDDYGFSSLVLKYKVVSRGRPSEENVAVLHFSDRIKTEGEIEFNWDMDQLNLYPGDYVLYYFEVADNDRISGPKVTRSRQYLARLPSLDEIIAETEAESIQRITKTEELYRQGKELAERLKNIARKIKAQSRQTKEADWQYQKELESITDQNMELVSQIEKMAQKMEQSLEKITENALMSREIMEKLMEIQKLFEEVATPEMKEAQRKLMEALQKMDPAELQKAMNEFQLSQEELLQRLERTLALLKRMQVEQKMEAMIRKAEQLVEDQKEMNEKTEASSEEALPNLSETEDELRASLKALKQEVADLKALAEEAKMNTSPEVRQFSEAVEKTDADRNMASMSQALSAMQKSSASSEGEKALAKLSEMLDMMQQQFMALKEGMDDQVMKAMRMALDDANYLSYQQEDLQQQAAMIDPASIMLRDMAAAQQDLISACSGLKNRISELGRKSPFVAAELQKLVSDAVQYMELATEAFSAGRSAQAMRNQHEAMVKLNRASIRLMESLNQQKQCKKGGNCNKNIAQLESLCNKQNQLNQQTKQCSKPGGELNFDGNQLQFRQTLERLAAEQASIRKSLEELNAEFGDSRQILGRLDEIAREMKEVEEALANGEIGEQTTQRQLRIYSRMLQATRSLQRKDFSEQRKATTAKAQPQYIPPALPAEILNDRVNFEDRLKQFLGDNYPPQYEEQIKAYFKALLQTETELYNLPQPAESIPQK
jgi:hypothetical protein